MTELIRVSFSLEKPLWARLKELTRRRRYGNRSEFIRDMIRDRLVEQEWENNEEALGTITLIYDHHARGLNEKLTELQHEHYHEIMAATHIHLDQHRCAEMIMVRGQAQHIRAIADLLRQQKGTLHAVLSLSSTGRKLV
jgi:CopG family nickel-responsive transcriptional regulator